MTQARLLLDEAAPGAWNMAVDEALLLTAESERKTTLRFYRWSEPTLSLGYFQKTSDRRLHSRSSKCTAVRRTTGGGAILHDQELTYSFTTPIANRLSRDAEAFYESFHAALIKALLAFGVTSRLCGDTAASEHGHESFLCFQRRTEMDVLQGDVKIAGSAQRRHKGAILQHGSVLLRSSAFAPELPGIADISGVLVKPEKLVQRWCLELGGLISIAPDTLSRGERERAALIEAEKFGQESWTARK